ncbi:hypothetical protein [Polaribacter glomeratus]|uniref:Chalcone isomerase domain-containing protein n=1 Tax=Polaribacter glomeratus TaxID=102 RepID=A0A2S7WGK5_9FLAO|nr:hypothetical protein [Polaribacter glomeratus]PQJ76735.1 hypothetical protein BTO16_12705 [Polaribacter glomeratus]TXD67423.1 hypothetical protein ESX12_02210 [Polaribacter glomeratus]
MKKAFLIITLFCSFFLSAQETEKENLIKLDSTWGKEVFPFPIRFAQEINYTGLAEVRFPPKGWRTPEHIFFWSYTYAWSINYDKNMTENQLASDLEKYFDGLNSVSETNNLNQKATATIVKTITEKTITFFEGKVATYDHFATSKRFVLNVKIASHFCEKTQKTLLLFKFSPKEFTHKVWQTLNEIELEKGFCKN